ncbi:MAG: DUF2100 domain-containing protein [Promethearchaeota archaeon]
MEKYLRFSPEDHKKLIDTTRDFLELKSYLRKYAPNFKIPNNESKNILEILEKAANFFLPTFLNLGIIEESNFNIKNPSKKVKFQGSPGSQDSSVNSQDNQPISNVSELLKKTENKIILVSSNRARKKLKSIGINPQFIKSSNGPIFIEDYEKLNIHLKENAKKGIKKGLFTFIHGLKTALQEKKGIVFIYSSEERTDNINLKSIEKLKKKIDGDVKPIKIHSWDYF